MTDNRDFHTGSTKSGARRRLRRALLITAVLVLVGGAVVMGLLGAAPGYWETNTIDGSDPQVAQRAQHFEQRVSSRTTAVRTESAPWQIELSQEELNAWLAARLPGWMRNRGMDERAVAYAERAMVAISNGQVELATRVNMGRFQPVVRFVYEPELNEAGRVQLTLTAMYAGLVPLPGDSLVDEVLEQFPDLDEEQQERIEHTRQLIRELDMVLHLGDGRVVSVIGMELEEGKVSLVCVTAPTAVRRDEPRRDSDSG